ncbi:MAG: SurA N-terminal domain-containing protein [Peptococcaceae bacterium]|nr:SurA N-terminal domain-containing protein [Peptococcaceae bacterium]
MKKKVAVLALGAFLMTGLFGCGDKVPEGTVATVNGTPISQEVLDENYNMVLRQYESYYGLDVTADDLKLEVRNAMLNELIMNELLLQEAEKREIVVSDEEVTAYIDDMVAGNYGGSQADFEAALEQVGMTPEYYQDSVKESMIITELQNDLVNHPETVDVIKARHILVETEEEALGIIARLDAGEDFAALAKEHSLDTGSAANGGDLGYFATNGATTSKMVDEFTAGAVALEIGEYSKTPVESQFGYHIILVEDKQAEVNLLEEGEKYSEVLSGIYRYGLDNLAASLMEKAEVEVLIDTTVVPEYPKAEETQNDGKQAEESAE